MRHSARKSRSLKKKENGEGPAVNDSQLVKPTATISPASTHPWHQAAANLHRKNEGKTVVEVVFESSDAKNGSNGDGSDGAESCGRSLWRGSGSRVYSLACSANGRPAASRASAADGNVTVMQGDPVEFLTSFAEPIDLLYMSGWPVGTPGYQEKHAEAYVAARKNFHERTVLLIGDTDRHHGGKAGLVLPKALDDKFEILLWGRMTLLARDSVAAVRDCVPRVGPAVPAEASLDDAIAMHKQGLHWEAEHVYRSILKEWPKHVVALHLLGVTLYQRGDHEGALQWIARAIALDPGKAAFFNNYGAALQGLGRHVEAMACFHRALQLLPDYADAISNLGLAQGSLGEVKVPFTEFDKHGQYE
jgi:tetratricopeptide (TPR) repeat protein